METLIDVNDWKKFVKAGKSTFTVENTNTQNRYTFRVSRCHDNQKSIWFVCVLSGPNNRTNYSYIGTIFDSEFRHTAKSRVREEAPSFKVFKWLNIFLQSERELPDNVQVYHEGFCGRCGRELTVPESIESGYGPECILLI